MAYSLDQHRRAADLHPAGARGDGRRHGERAAQPPDVDIVMFLDIHDVKAVRVGIGGHVERRLISVRLQRLIRSNAAAAEIEPQDRFYLPHRRSFISGSRRL
jgi:hypothetical protein